MYILIRKSMGGLRVDLDMRVLSEGGSLCPACSEPVKRPGGALNGMEDNVPWQGESVTASGS
ncbi:MAG: hypothetical protein R2729_22440 [Bryobacteraceae bacterium]